MNRHHQLYTEEIKRLHHRFDHSVRMMRRVLESTQVQIEACVGMNSTHMVRLESDDKNITLNTAHLVASTRRFFLMLAVVLGFFILPAGQTPSAYAASTTCVDATNDLGGTIFRDFDNDGINDIGSSPDTAFYDANNLITVYAYDITNSVVVTQAVGSDGTYNFDDIFSSNTYIRLEFTGLPSYLNAGYSGTDNRTETQFYAAGTCAADLGVHNPSDFCETNPNAAASCFVSSDPKSTDGPFDVLVTWPYNREGKDVNASGWVAPTSIAAKSDIGSVWGLAYARETNMLYSAAFLKRHVGLNELDPQDDSALNNPLAVIYKTDADTGTNSVFIDLSTESVNVGTIGDNAARGVDVAPSSPSTDPTAYPLVGKVGLGDVDISSDESTLYVVNLGNKELVSVAINPDGTAGTVSTVAIPDPGCVNGEHRPFALTVYQDDVYIGMVCDGTTNDDPADLTATVMRWDGGTNFTNIFTFGLDYTKGQPRTDGDCGDYPGWFAWRDTWVEVCRDNSGGSIDEVIYVYPQPILSDIEFDKDGSMMLAFMDRFGHQMGFRNSNLTSLSPANNITTIGGDILRVYNNNGTYVLESNGTAGPHTTSDDNNGQGPGGGEFYYEDDGGGHSENSYGGLAFHTAREELMLSMLRPDGGPWATGGVGRFDSTTGTLTGAYALYQGANNSESGLASGYFGKATGLGDAELLCQPAPIEVGNYVWDDTDGDGVQDPNESGLADIDVTLYDITGTVIATTTTDAGGEYYFNDSNVTQNGASGLQPNTTYEVCVPLNDADLGGRTITTQDYASNANHPTSGISTDVHDSDGDNDVILAGHSCVQIITGAAGENDYTIDFGFASQPSVAVEKILNTVDPVLPATPVSFTIRITNTGTTPIATLPLTDTYSSVYLNFVSATPAADTSGNTGQILWSDLTQSAPNGFGTDLDPGQSFDVVVNFLAGIDTSALPDSATINTAIVFTQTATDTLRVFNATNVVLSNREVNVETIDGQDMHVLTWSTVDETDLVGFHVLRLDEAGGEPMRLTSDEEIILAHAANGADYRFEDAVGDADANHHYVLEMVMADGTHPLMDMGTSSQAPSMWMIYLPVLRK
ncbi:MAG: SdrD B-like domain-containing protein [Chloroflexota bacterium]